jgi:hypothetical protein
LSQEKVLAGLAALMLMERRVEPRDVSQCYNKAEKQGEAERTYSSAAI